MNKQQRHQEILDLITSRNIKTQTEIVDHFREKGIEITQATISRDIKELKLFKTPFSGDLIYTTDLAESKGRTQLKPGTELTQEQKEFNRRTRKIFRETIVDFRKTHFIIVVKTLPGMAQATALIIDRLEWPEIAGTIAGDDTIFVAVMENTSVEQIIEKFKALINSGTGEYDA